MSRSELCQIDLTALERTTHLVQSGHAGEIVCLDFSNTLDKASHDTLVDEMGNCGLQATIVRWIESRLNKCSQEVLLNGSTSTTAGGCHLWGATGLHFGPSADPVLNDLDEGINRRSNLQMTQSYLRGSR